MANPYTPEEILNKIHGLPRYGGVNQIPIGDTDNFDPATLLDDGVYRDYAIGVGTPAAVMIVFYFVWLCMLGCAPICKRSCKCCNNKCVVFFFLLSVLTSILGWFISISGSNTLKTGVVDMFNDIDDTVALIANAEESVNNISSFADPIITSAEAANDTCKVFTPVAGAFPLTELTNLVNQSLSSVETGTDSTADIQKALDEVSAVFTDVEENWDRSYFILTTSIIVILLVFTVSTLIKLIDVSPHCGQCNPTVITINNSLQKFQCIVLFTVGLILVSIAYWVSAIFSPLIIVGADLCVPSFTDNAIEVAAAFLNYSDVDAFCGDLENGSLPVGPTICYYAYCEGSNPLLEVFGLENTSAIVSDYLDDATEEIETLSDGLATLNFSFFSIAWSQPGSDPVNTNIGPVSSGAFPSVVSSCNDSISDVTDGFSTIDSAFTDALEIADCSSVTPLVNSLTDASLCNGVIAGAGVVLFTWACGCIGFMLSLFFYCLLRTEGDPAELIARGIIPKNAVAIDDAPMAKAI
mmetsp:Transcript_10127/g.11630  ORF Transcript_10127/g.11630 Transcript_10127/m.11630 type:complete len:524 (-) Transcript_10127:123-1694(-)|eukprot:CAMPEP_0184022158 /NCGR_PEP_ID=MMETSP0954-20121128/10428_1 /TAXON_ID=627963 /ORGANISM="Aplanochytrium sp, Strain PBS07" /LENGTH=523 /DNA_ID=CAMNT_0026304457 /DNA_START=206 /DNA_END=1777 /DNA_ORIENTATION=-